MALQIGAALRDAGSRLVSRTGAILLGTYLLLLLGLQSMLNSLLATVYARMGLGAAVEALPLVVDVPVAVAGGGVLLAILLTTYHSIVSTRTFVADARDRFPGDALTRNVPLAILNVFVGGFVYGLLVFLGSLLLLVPGLIAYVAFLFLVPYVAVEDRNFVDALGASYRLGKGNWLQLFVLVLVAVGGASVVGAVVGVVGSLLLPPAAAQLAIIVVQPPVALYTLALIAVAFDQLRDATDGDRPDTAADVGTSPTA
ncbi:hypothetical protein [Haloarcula litorea]|uniref:hypothetical protein n=1 Tax=Haloarcula litorea TaxID=3032579 RepID=UPI0023E7A351|nr:hypothetical protein [Halomicroarcula sp. GDY20]